MATDVKARLTNTGFSAQKVRLVIDMVRGKSVADALNIEYSSAILEEGNEGHGKGSGSEGKKKKDSSSANGEEHEERDSSGEHKGRKKK